MPSYDLWKQDPKMLGYGPFRISLRKILFQGGAEVCSAVSHTEVSHLL